MADLKIYSAIVCPYAHRTRLVLLEKGIPFELHEIDLQNKPEGFTQISPYGKVPALVHGDRRVWESAIINEYLDEVFPEPSLLPTDAGDRALARIWIDFANTRLVNAYGTLLRNPDSQEQQRAAEELRNHLHFIETVAFQHSNEGPYWFGASISLVDLTYYPWFERWVTIEQYRNFHALSEFPHLQRWREAVSQRESVKAIANAPAFYLERYARFVAVPAR